MSLREIPFVSKVDAAQCARRNDRIIANAHAAPYAYNPHGSSDFPTANTRRQGTRRISHRPGALLIS